MFLAFYQTQTVKLDESIKDDVPALLSQGEVNKPQENVINDEPIRPDSPKEDLKKAEPISLAPPKVVENVKVTAYVPCDSIPKGIKNYEKIKRRNGTGTNITASGELLHDGGVAADKRYYPKGTVFYVPKIGKTLVVNDTGGNVRGKYHIDFLLKDYQKAMEWGSPKLEVWVMVAQK